MKRLLIAFIFLIITAVGVSAQTTSSTARRLAPSTFAALGTPPNGSVRYCSNCQATSPCTSGGTGAMASRVAGAWNCSTGSSGTGDVAGPASSTDNAVARFDGTTGKLIQNSTVTVSDMGAQSSAINQTAAPLVTGLFVNVYDDPAVAPTGVAAHAIRGSLSTGWKNPQSFAGKFIFGADFYAGHDGSGDIAAIYGVKGEAQKWEEGGAVSAEIAGGVFTGLNHAANSTLVPTVFGVFARADNGASGTGFNSRTSELHGIGARIKNYEGTTTNGYGIKIWSPQVDAGTVTNLYGLRIDPQTVGSTLNYNVYSAGATSNNLFEGITTLGKAGVRTGQLDFAGTTSGVVSVKPADVAGTWTLTLPAIDGDNGQALTTNGSGVASWTTIAATPGGSDTQIQFNDGGAFGGDAGLIYNKTTDVLTIGVAGVSGGLSLVGGQIFFPSGTFPQVVSLDASNSGLFLNGITVGFSVGASAKLSVDTTTTTIHNTLKLTPIAFASLPASPSEGMVAWVNNSSTATWGDTITGGGANKVLAVYNGTNWTVVGK